MGLNDEKDEGLSEEEQAALDAENNDDNDDNDDDDDGLTDLEREQVERGWTPKDEWVAAGNDEADWRSAAHFKTIGENVRYKNENKGLREAQAGFDKRLRRNETLFEESTKQLITDLEAQRDIHTEAGELDESKAIQDRIDKTRSTASTTTVSDDAGDPIIIAWNKANPWIDNPGPKSQYAGALYERAKADGLTSQEIVDYVDEEVEKEYPGVKKSGKTTVINARRNEASTTQTGKTKTGKTSGLALSDLTADEKNQRGNSDYLSGMDDKKFLVLVSRARDKEAEENK